MVDIFYFLYYSAFGGAREKGLHGALRVVPRDLGVVAVAQRPAWKSDDATLARWRGGGGSSPRREELISTQVAAPRPQPQGDLVPPGVRHEGFFGL